MELSYLVLISLMSNEKISYYEKGSSHQSRSIKPYRKIFIYMPRKYMPCLRNIFLVPSRLPYNLIVTRRYA